MFYLYNTEFIFIEETSGQIDPLESEKQNETIYLQPANSTTIPIPETTLEPGYYWKFTVDTWISYPNFEEIPLYHKTEKTHKYYSKGIEPNWENYTRIAPVLYTEYETWNGNEWAVDESQRLFHSKSKKLEESKVEFELTKESYTGTISYINTTWDSGEMYLKNCNSKLREISKGNISIPITWVDYNDQAHSLTEVQLEGLKNLIETDLDTMGTNLYEKKWLYKSQINACSTVEEVEAIAIEY
ncbi:MAG: hypothetical protein AAF518_27480 [Spirochaetota bacterium]